MEASEGQAILCIFCKLACRTGSTAAIEVKGVFSLVSHLLSPQNAKNPATLSGAGLTQGGFHRHVKQLGELLSGTIAGSHIASSAKYRSRIPPSRARKVSSGPSFQIEISISAAGKGFSLA